MKKILFVNGSYNEIPLIAAAHRLGLYVITSGNDPRGDGHRYANEYCPCDYSDKEAILKLASEKKVDAICSCGNDLGAISASYASEKLGLPGHDSYEVCRVFHEKNVFKKYVKELGLSSPMTASFSDEFSALEYVTEVAFPQIIKPVDLGGGKGVTVVHTQEEAIAAVKKAFQMSKVKHIVIEDFIEGTQHCFICYIKDQKVVFDYSSNDYSYINPYMVWVSSGCPADGYHMVRDKIIDDVNRLAQYTQAADGILTIQYMMKDGKAYYLETMRRCLGNFHFACMSKDRNIDLYELFVATEAGMDCSHYFENMHETVSCSGFMGIYGNKNGKVKSISFDPEFEKHIYDRVMLAGPGYVIDDYLGDKLGNVFFTWKNREERDRFMQKKYDLFKITYEE